MYEEQIQTITAQVAEALAEQALPFAPDRRAALDLPVCLGLCVLSTVPPLLEGRYRRWQGALLLGLYGAYLAVLAGK